jgi:putative endonuclease
LNIEWLKINLMEFHDLGKKGEIVAANYLISRGYEIVDANYFNKKGYRKGEIDLVAKDKDGCIVFVEVKSRKGEKGSVVPEENITSAKIRKIIKAANFFLNANSFQEHNWRIDSISVIFNFKTRKLDIRHIKAIRI